MPPPLVTGFTASDSRYPTGVAAPGRTSRSIAVCRSPFPCRCCRGRGKKPNTGPTAPPLLLLPEGFFPAWLVRCLRALAAAALALSLSAPSLLQAAHAAASGGRSPLDATAYACEDVGRYYAGLDGLTGDELKAKLAAVVSPHAALRYKEVWVALKILDAADEEHPEASSEVYDAEQPEASYEHVL